MKRFSTHEAAETMKAALPPSAWAEALFYADDEYVKDVIADIKRLGIQDKVAEEIRKYLRLTDALLSEKPMAIRGGNLPRLTVY